MDGTVRPLEMILVTSPSNGTHTDHKAWTEFGQEFLPGQIHLQKPQISFKTSVATSQSDISLSSGFKSKRNLSSGQCIDERNSDEDNPSTETTHMKAANKVGLYQDGYSPVTKVNDKACGLQYIQAIRLDSAKPTSERHPTNRSEPQNSGRSTAYRAHTWLSGNSNRKPQSSAASALIRRPGLPWLDGQLRTPKRTASPPASSLLRMPGEFFYEVDSAQNNITAAPSLKKPEVAQQDSRDRPLSGKELLAANSPESIVGVSKIHGRPSQLLKLPVPEWTPIVIQKQEGSPTSQRSPKIPILNDTFTLELTPENLFPLPPISMSPSQIKKSARETSRHNSVNSKEFEQSFRRSIVGLERLMEEAAALVKVASKVENTNEVPVILNEATKALRQASKVQDRQRHWIDVSLPSSGVSSDTSDLSSSAGSMHSSPRGRSGFDELDHFPNKCSPDSIRLNPSHAFEGPEMIETVDFRSSRRQKRLSSSTSSPRHQPTPVRRHVTFPAKPEEAQSSSRELINFPLRSWTVRAENHEPIDQRQGQSMSRRRSLLEPHLISILQDSAINVKNPRTCDLIDVPLRVDPNDTSPARTPSFDASPLRASDKRGNLDSEKYADEKDYQTPGALKGRHHLSLRAHQGFSLNRHHRRQPIARNWSATRKRLTALITCINTAIVGILIGIYAGEVPAIQYSLADENHYVILGNVLLYIGLALSTFIFWPLPLLHGRKPYLLAALAIALPLQFPQAIIVATQRDPGNPSYRAGLLLSRAVSGIVLGFANVNFKTTLLDLFGASLQSESPHQELVVVNDVRRHGGGMGLWLGIWTWCFTGSLAVGFLIGASIISELNVAWGFYISVILIAATLVLGVISPETRRARYRRTIQEVELPDETISRRVARGEIRMHILADGPKWWTEEVVAGLYLSFKMLLQIGFSVVALYLGWIYAQIVLIIVLLGNLLSRDYGWRPEYVGLGVSSVAFGALLAVPLSKANVFSRARTHGPRTDSMTFQPRVTRSSHLVRRVLFMIALPLAGLAYTLASEGPSTHYMVPIMFAGLIGFLSNLAIAECHGLIMETYDTSDLQPGVNSRHRLQSMASATRQRRTVYSSYPRVSAGFFLSQTLGFLFAAVATGVGGRVTRHVGAQKATAIVASILLGLTVLLTLVLWRFKQVQVIPNELFGNYFGTAKLRRDTTDTVDSARSWRAVVIGNPSGKMRRMSMLELGGLSRWTEIRRLNRLLTRASTKALNEGWR